MLSKSRCLHVLALILVVTLLCEGQRGPVRVIITPQSPVQLVGDTPSLTAKTGFFTGLNQTGGGKTAMGPVSWLSSQTSVATVIANTGATSALATGTTTMSAQRGPFFGTTLYTVAADAGAILTSVTVNPGTASIPKGMTMPFTATGGFNTGQSADVTSAAAFSSANPAIARVSTTFGIPGMVTGISVGGPTNINANLGGVIGSSSVTVTNAALASLAVTPVNPAIDTGTTQQFTATGTFTDTTTQNLTGSSTWGSTNMSVATITSGGLASGLAAGMSTISATNGTKSDSTTLTVNPSPYGNSGNPYADETITNPTTVSGCRTGNNSISAPGTYQLTQNIGSDPTATCITINAINVILDLNGKTITGRVVASPYNGNIPAGLHLFNGTINCNFVTGDDNDGCINVQNDASSLASEIRFHHLTLSNVADQSAALLVVWNMQTTSQPQPIRMYHITAAAPQIIPTSTSRIDILAATGQAHTGGMGPRIEFANNDLTCPANVRACETTICFDVGFCSVHDNRLTMGNSGVNDSGRAILIDGDQNNRNTQGSEVFNNLITATNNRAVRIRNSINGNIHDNTIKNVLQAVGAGPEDLAAIHLGDPDPSGVSDGNINTIVQNNTLEENQGILMMMRDATGITVNNNTVIRVGSCLANASNCKFFANVEHQIAAATTQVNFNNNTPGSYPQPWINAESSTSGTVCKSGTVGGPGSGNFTINNSIC